MNLLDNFYVDSDNRIRLNKYVLVVRNYKTLAKDTYDDNTYYVDDKCYTEWIVNFIPKHQLVELVSETELDTSAYAWMDEIKLRSDNYWKEIDEIAACGSLEAYEATLPESRDAFEIETDYRLSMLELGI